MKRPVIHKEKLSSLLILYISLALKLMVLAPVQTERLKTISALKSSQSKHTTKSQEMETDKEGAQAQLYRSSQPRRSSNHTAVKVLNGYCRKGAAQSKI